MKGIQIIKTNKVEKDYRRPLSKLQRWICNVFQITPRQGDFTCDIDITVSSEDASYLYPSMILQGFSGDHYTILSKTVYSNTIKLRSHLYVDKEESYGFVVVGSAYEEKHK